MIIRDNRWKPIHGFICESESLCLSLIIQFVHINFEQAVIRKPSEQSKRVYLNSYYHNSYYYNSYYYNSYSIAIITIAIITMAIITIALITYHAYHAYHKYTGHIICTYLVYCFVSYVLIFLYVMNIISTYCPNYCIII